MSTMSSPELVYCALVALAGYALFLISSHIRADNNTPARRRRAKPPVPVATAGGGAAQVTAVLPRRKVVQRNLSVYDSDIEEIAPPPSTQQGSSSGAGAAPRSGPDSTSRPVHGSSRARSRSSSVVDAPGQLSTLDQLLAQVRNRGNSSVVPLALTVGINPLAPLAPCAEPFPAPVSPLSAHRPSPPPEARLLPVRVTSPHPLSPLALPSPALQPHDHRAPSSEPSAVDHVDPAGPSSVDRAPSAGPSGAYMDHPAALEPLLGTPAGSGRSTGVAQRTLNGSPVIRTERKVTPRPKGNAPRKTIITPYWAPKAPALELIDAPPDLTSDPELAPGDVFHWFTATQYRLWVWVTDDDGFLKWQAVAYGHKRSDGRRLIVTPQTNVPSWVSQERYADLDHAMRWKDAYVPEE